MTPQPPAPLLALIAAIRMQKSLLVDQGDEINVYWPDQVDPLLDELETLLTAYNELLAAKGGGEGDDGARAYAVVDKNGGLQKLYYSRPPETDIRYWDNQWPKYGPHRIVEMRAAPPTPGPEVRS